MLFSNLVWLTLVDSLIKTSLNNFKPISTLTMAKEPSRKSQSLMPTKSSVPSAWMTQHATLIPMVLLRVTKSSASTMPGKLMSLIDLYEKTFIQS